MKSQPTGKVSTSLDISGATGYWNKTGTRLGARDLWRPGGTAGAADELAREWYWLHDTLNKVARVRAEQGDAHAFRLLQAQAMAVGQRRIGTLRPHCRVAGATGRTVSHEGTAGLAARNRYARESEARKTLVT
jgi:hypothetical protein